LCECFWVWFCLTLCTDCESVSGCDSVWYNARIVRVFLGVILSDTMHGLWECFWVWFCLIQCTNCESVSGCDSVWYNARIVSVSGCDSVWHYARIVRVFLGVILSDTMHGLWECFWVWFCLIQCTGCESVSGCVSVWYNARNVSVSKCVSA